MTKRLIFIIWPLSVFLALLIDTLTPLGFADYIFYSGILFLFVYANKKYILLAGITSIALIIIGYFLSPNDFSVPPEIAIANRVLGVLLVVFIMYVILRFSKRGIQLSEKINALEDANKELESFNFISSHDIQEPLRKIQIFVSLLQEEKNISTDGKYYLERLSKSSDQMRMLIEDLLKYSHINKKDNDFDDVNLNTIFDKLMANNKEAIAEKKAHVKIEGNCRARIIPALFSQVMSNLIENSLKFSHPDRQLQIIIRSEFISNDKLIPELSTDLSYCHINFTDNGIGFEPQYNERVFKFFRRLNGQEYPGTGLGLAICRKIIEKHNGIIKANGILNKGVQFDIYIPV